MSIGETIALKLGLMVMKMTIACEQTRINACVWLVVWHSVEHRSVIGELSVLRSTCS